MAMEMAMATLIKFRYIFLCEKIWTENNAWTENTAWTENKRGYLISNNSLVCTTGVDLNKRGLEPSVDLNKAWTVSLGWTVSVSVDGFR